MVSNRVKVSEAYLCAFVATVTFCHELVSGEFIFNKVVPSVQGTLVFHINISKVV